MARFLTAAKGLACALALSVAPAQAIIFDDEELERRLNELEERLLQMEATMQQLAGKLRESSAKEQELLDLIRQFQGGIEELGFKVDQREEAMQSVISDIDASLRTEIADLASQIEEIRGAAEQAAAAAAKAEALSDEEYYERGYANYQAGAFEDAIGDFSQLVDFYPESSFVPNSRYWIGMSNLSLLRNEEAIETLKGFIDRNPRSARAPEAMLSLADAYAGIGNQEANKKTLESLVKAYPSSLAADSARQKIKSL